MKALIRVTHWERVSLSRRIPCAFARVGLLLIAVFTLLSEIGPQLSIYYVTRLLAAKDPAVSVTPRPLTDVSVSQASGMAFSYLGFTFDAPWDAGITKQDVFDHLVAIRFDDGKAIMLIVPENQSGLLNEIVEDQKLKMSSLKPLLGELLKLPDYDQYLALLSTSPQNVRAFGPRTDAARGQVLLMIKSMAFHSNLETGVYTFDFDGMRGFQIGDPQKSQRVDLEIFEANGVHAEMALLTTPKKGAPISQPEVNRILASFRAVNAAKLAAEHTHPSQ